jgi:hypothetical protein
LTDSCSASSKNVAAGRNADLLKMDPCSQQKYNRQIVLIFAGVSIKNAGHGHT